MKSERGQRKWKGNQLWGSRLWKCGHTIVVAMHQSEGFAGEWYFLNASNNVNFKVISYVVSLLTLSYSNIFYPPSYSAPQRSWPLVTALMTPSAPTYLPTKNITVAMTSNWKKENPDLAFLVSSASDADLDRVDDLLGA